MEPTRRRQAEVEHMAEAAVRVLVVDDSALMRRMISNILRAAGMEVVGTARDGIEAIDKTRELRPDVLTLDLEMPRMDGITFLSLMMREQPTPVVVLTGQQQSEADGARRCLELGAVDCLRKPSGKISVDLDRVGGDLAASVLAAARAGDGCPRRACSASAAREAAAETGCGGCLRGACCIPVVVIAASTGGPAALTRVVPALPAGFGGWVVIVQHLPPGFSAALAARLGEVSSLSVREARTGDAPEPGVALVAPANQHLVFDSDGCVTFSDRPALWGVRPAADLTLTSAAERFGCRTVGIVLSGMGRDGAEGAAAVRRAHGCCIAQDEATSTIYGMPRAAREAGAVDVVAPIQEIASRVVEAVGRARERCTRNGGCAVCA